MIFTDGYSLKVEKKFPLFLPIKQDEEEIRTFAKHFSCQNEEWCDDLYEPEEIQSVFAWMDSVLYPPECNQNTRYLVLNGKHLYGFGSVIHTRAYALGLAVSDGRVLVEDSDMHLHWAASVCSLPDVFSCWLRSSSKCPVPLDWKSIATFHQPGLKDLITYFPYTKLLEPRIDVHPWRNKPTSWHLAVLSTYLIRPNSRFIEQSFRPAMLEIFPATLGHPPVRMISVFIRQGDKGSETPIYSVAQYFEEVAPLAMKFNITDLFLASDSGEAIQEALQVYGHQYQIHTLDPTKRLARGYFHNDIAEERKARIIELTILDVLISTYGSIFVGDLHSNQCRLIDELRKVNLKARFPLLSPGGPNLISSFDPRISRRIRNAHIRQKKFHLLSTFLVLLFCFSILCLFCLR